MDQLRKDPHQTSGESAAPEPMSRRKMIASIGLAGVAAASAALLGSGVIRADTPVHESVYGVPGSGSCALNIAELRTMSGAVCRTVHVLGYYEANDGGGGLFYWDGGSTAADNGGTVIQPAGIATGRWLRNM
ncbi:MAG: hypothetical protein K0Q94_3735 [Paenibacillus sp.]|uniref:hypothetical protein n=1 Tax=unclassified Paenibacillus TaxID=185978 RepID=UPI0029ECC006|nr:hypothetical protein [Paenibacillus sp.]